MSTDDVTPDREDVLRAKRRDLDHARLLVAEERALGVTLSSVAMVERLEREVAALEAADDPRGVRHRDRLAPLIPWWEET